MRHLIWDMGGTLVDTYPEVVRVLSQAACGDVSPTTLRETASLTRVSIAHAITVLASARGVPQADLEQAYEDLKARWRTHPAPVMDGALELMAHVRSRGGLNLVATHRDRPSATALLTALGLEPDDLVCAPDGLARKPDPAMSLLLARRHRLEPGEVVCVGDRAIDVVAAARAGMAPALLVRPGSAVRLDEGSLGALAASTLVVADLRDLIPLF